MESALTRPRQQPGGSPPMVETRGQLRRRPLAEARDGDSPVLRLAASASMSAAGGALTFAQQDAGQTEWPANGASLRREASRNAAGPAGAVRRAAK